MDKQEKARVMAGKFYDIPIAMTVLDGKVYGAFIGNWKPYAIPADVATATLALEMGLFKLEKEGEIDGKPVQWMMNRR